MTDMDTAPDTLIPYEGMENFDKKSARRIGLLVEIRPLLDQANSTHDEAILLHAADECEKRCLYFLAEKYRRRAGIKQESDTFRKQTQVQRAIDFIYEHGRSSSPEIRKFLGLTKHQYEVVLTSLRNSGKVANAGNDYVPITDVLF